MSIDFHNTLKHRRDKLTKDIQLEENRQIPVNGDYLEKALEAIEKVQILMLQKRSGRDGESFRPVTQIERELQAVQEFIARAFYDEGDWPLEYFDTEEDEED